AVQKADFILGPVFVGLFWHRRRPNNRLGVLLIALGLLGIPYILESTSRPSLFSIGVETEFPLFLMTLVVIVAFPSGRLDGLPERLIIGVMLLTSILSGVLFLLVSPEGFVPSLSISGCRGLCPADPLAIWSYPSWYGALVDFARVGGSVAWLATAGLFVWRFVTGTPPRRRALAIGAPIAMCYLLTSAAYQTVQLVNPNFAVRTAEPLNGPFQWAIAATTSAVWYGFLLALIAAESFAGRTLRRLVRDSLGRPSFHELERMLCGPLGDPGLRLGFWRPGSRDWADADGGVMEPAGAGQAVTEVARDGRRAAAIVHDKQLTEDPELLQAAGAVTLMALENAELDAASKQALSELRDSRDELRDSRARLVSVGARERRKLERDLHDGAQQLLVAASINLSVARELADSNPQLNERVTEASSEVDDALVQLRELAHGIYPQALSRFGLARALDVVVARYPGRVEVIAATAARFPPEVEAAVYYCCLEAVQNASKHAGPDAHVSIRLYTEADLLHLEVCDNGPGFDVTAAHDGVGLQNMRDRLGAVRGTVEIASEPGHGTRVRATVPVGRDI
ncbi:MAG TPA: histidine kinase, partial [Solirubrobacteraceae bacterium]|nr:histidine kinase [Solirubrobacteraceae bacterium]